MNINHRPIPIRPGFERIELEPSPNGSESNAAALLIHGIAARPRQLEDLAVPLSDAGYYVVAPLLPGHGTDPSDLIALGWQDWYRCVENEYLELTARYDRVTVIGFSLGASLALELAANHRVDELVLMCTPLKTFMKFVPQAPALWLLERMTRYVPTFRKTVRRSSGEPAPRGIYKRIPVVTLRSMYNLIRRNRGRLAEVTAPTLILHATSDLTSRRKGAFLLAQKLASVDKSIVWLRTRRHEISRFEKKDYVIDQILRFTGRVSTNSGSPAA